jgi:filamentous hemagglutinin family protein
MNLLKKFFPVLFLTILSIPTPAQIVLDGSLGAADALLGPDYQIGAELGQQRGGNLFHSFSEFNLQPNEIASFNGPNSIQNIITRVTGGHPSQINGTLRSTIPEANLYFLNPYGILFGAHAKLDLQGSFHASTADTLYFSDGGQFNAQTPAESLLTVAPPSAFGFLSNTPPSIRFQDGVLSVSEGKTLSLIGGDLYFDGQPPNEDNPFDLQFNTSLTAPYGRLNLASVASAGTVTPTDFGLEFSDNMRGGHITANNIELSANGVGGGDVFIRAGELYLSKSQIGSRTFGDQDGGIINIQADNFSLQKNSKVNVRTYGAGKGSDVVLNVTGTLKISKLGGIFGTSLSEEENAGNSGTIKITADEIINEEGAISTAAYRANAGDIIIETNDLILTEGAYIISTTIGIGDGGDIDIQAAGTVKIEGASPERGEQTGIFATTKPWREGTIGGKGGNIRLTAKQLIINGGRIDASTSTARVSVEQPIGKAGNIMIDVDGEVKLSGINPYGEDEDGLAAGIYVRSLGNNAGQAGTLYLTADSLVIEQGAVITSSTNNQAPGGDIIIQITNALSIDGDSSQIVLGEPGASQIRFRQQLPDYQPPISISGIYTSSTSSTLGAGEAGNLHLSATDLKLTQGGSINTSTQNAGGGHITLALPHFGYLRHSEMTTSVIGGVSNGGNITITHPLAVVLDNALIKAQANAGRGGNIDIFAGDFIASPDSLVSASSELGIDGEVNISSPERNYAGRLYHLAQEIFDATAWLNQECDIEDISELSTFNYQHEHDGAPMAPGDFMD